MDPAERADSPTSAAVPAPALTSEILAWHEITRRYRRPLGGWWWAALVLVPLVLALLSTTFGIGAQLEANAAPAPSVSVSVPVASPSQPAAAGEKVPIAQAVAGTGQITFGNKKSELTASGRRAVEAAARLLKACPKAAVTVEGYTDGLGTPQGNKKVSQQRADQVKHLLQKLGLSNPIRAKGRSGAKLIADNSTKAGQAANRRAEISVR